MCGPNDGEETLRSRVADEDVLSLFEEDPDEVAGGVRRLVRRTENDADLVVQLSDLLAAALDEDCDDSQASIWLAVTLGESGSSLAVPVLLRTLTHPDETLQDAAFVALLRLGPPAISGAMEWVDEDFGLEFARQAYRLLGETGLHQDPVLQERVTAYLEERWEMERAHGDVRCVEALAEAFARLGHRSMLGEIEAVVDRRFHGSHPLIEDAAASLRDNEAGVAFVPTMPPWSERYGWIFETDDRTRPRGRGSEGSSSEGGAFPP